MSYAASPDADLRKRVLRTGYNILSPIFGAAHRLILNAINRGRNAGKDTRYLEIGPGLKPIDGFEALNIVWTPGVDYVHSATRDLPFADNSFDMVYASHILEHIAWYQVPATLAEWYRIVKPGGTIELWVPNGLEIARAFVRAEDGEPNAIDRDGWYRFNPDRDPAAWAAGRLFSYGDGEGTRGHFNWHLALFSERYLANLLVDAGFAATRRMDRSEVRGYDHGWINMGIVGTK